MSPIVIPIRQGLGLLQDLVLANLSAWISLGITLYLGLCSNSHYTLGWPVKMIDSYSPSSLLLMALKCFYLSLKHHIFKVFMHLFSFYSKAEGKIFQLLVYFLSSCIRQCWVRLKPQHSDWGQGPKNLRDHLPPGVCNSSELEWRIWDSTRHRDAGCQKMS